MLGTLLAPVQAEASRINDWQCLTEDMTGHEANRDQYIRASAEASRVFNIAPSILVAIKRVESGRGLNPSVSNRNNNGTTDRGFYQVNTEVWLPEIRRVGGSMAMEDLHGIRENALVAAWVLRRQMNRSDVPNTLEAVGYYHKGGGTDSRSRNIRQVYKDKFLAELRKMMSRCA
jgi:hypothetical protein